ncbi:DUF3996 domain-containing protein [Borrelia persica]|uniref:DUF3996 domain-containing protein n=1 Tax=Borrelia persica TaxID=44448 RepID=UPI000464C48A|nr:DUF3996 domain-containing protein [Borrelia persica]
MKTQLKIIMIFMSISLSVATTIDTDALNKALNKQHSKNSSHQKQQFSIGFGIGNPITNIMFDFPYVGVDFGYGGFNGLHPNNFIPYIVVGTDILFKEEVYHNTTLTGGVGIGVDLSQVKQNEQDASNVTLNNQNQNKQEEFSLTSSNNRLGITLRLPIILEYAFLKNVVIGFKAITTIGGTIKFNPSTSMEGIRFSFLGFGFIKLYM